jgi:cytoskeletal protein RodZ
MAHHEDSHDHGHDMTEGKRQYYPSGWYLPLVALVAIGIVFAFGAGSLLGISGTDKWGKNNTHETAEGHGHDDVHHDGDNHATEAPDASAADNHHNTDSTPAAAADPADSTAKADSVAPKADAGHEGHGH